jgi:hypothetical protein
MESNYPARDSRNKFQKYYSPLEPLLTKPKNRMYTAAIFSFFAISLFGWYAIRPTLNTIILLRKEIEEKKVINKQMEDKITQLIEAQSNYQQIENQLILLDDAIPQNPDVIDLSTQLKNLVATTESTISSLILSGSVPLLSNESASDKLKINSQKDFDIGITLDGDYTEIEKVLEKVNNMRRVVNTLSFSFGEPKNNGKSNVSSSWLGLVLRLKSYYQPK